jgi:hypothetical protein
MVAAIPEAARSYAGLAASLQCCCGPARTAAGTKLAFSAFAKTSPGSAAVAVHRQGDEVRLVLEAGGS